MAARPDDVTLDTDRPSTMPGFTERERVERGLEDVLDGFLELLRDEIDYRRSQSEPPPDGDRPTLPSLH